MSSNINSLRLCSDIGMWALDRSKATCGFATEFCKAHCYNKKLYRMYSAMEKRDEQNENYWRNTPHGDISKDIAKAMQHSKGSHNRFRFATRGEAVGTFSDMYKVISIADSLPDVHFWVPTRAWRAYSIRTALSPVRGALYNLLVRARENFPNLHLMASVDPTTTDDELLMLIKHGWSTIAFGTERRDWQLECPKTYQGLK